VTGQLVLGGASAIAVLALFFVLFAIFLLVPPALPAVMLAAFGANYVRKAVIRGLARPVV
jgi:hypothetical protein